MGLAHVCGKAIEDACLKVQVSEYSRNYIVTNYMLYTVIIKSFKNDIFENIIMRLSTVLLTNPSMYYVSVVSRSLMELADSFMKEHMRTIGLL